MLVKDGPLSMLKEVSYPQCESCLEGIRANRLMQTNACGPMSISTREGYDYYVTFIKDYSRYGYVYLMHRKSKTFDNF
ncbi:hypothetical protein J1N35_034523 [Gossypium stocksii]|uniref:GAG-pre-integrase domain-containing protein n=1 Tax=Gossypium stocksii TaxID=47602 RepID=A0A9D3USA5_9ROSI|nr:hypothetical protein J1N35_034523 [Gossypium stocksii]